MTVDKACGARGCAFANHRCGHSWVARFQAHQQRYVIRVDDFAFARGATAHVDSKRDADRWSLRMIAEAQAGEDPRRPPPAPPVAPPADTIAALLDDYQAARLPQLRQTATPRSELRHLRAFFSDADPATLLESESRVAEYVLALRAGWRPDRAPTAGRGVIAVNRLLTRWRNVVEWSRGQRPPRLTRTPFHAYGTVIKTSEEEPRTRRLQDGEEAALFAALAGLDDKQHRFRADVMQRLLLGVLHAALRLSEAVRVRTTDIDWTRGTIALRKGRQKVKGQDARYIPFERDGVLHQALLTRRFLKAPANFVFGNDDGTALDANRAQTANFRRAWVTLNLTAHGWLPAPEEVYVTAGRGLRAIGLRCATCVGNAPRGGGGRRSPDHPAPPRAFDHQDHRAVSATAGHRRFSRATRGRAGVGRVANASRMHHKCTTIGGSGHEPLRGERRQVMWRKGLRMVARGGIEPSTLRFSVGFRPSFLIWPALTGTGPHRTFRQ